MTLQDTVSAMRNTGCQSCADSVQKEDFRDEEAMHIVYIMCGEERSHEFMASLKSLHLFAKVALNADQNYYHIHVITADTNGTEEVGGLQPRSNFRLTFHKMVMEAPELFGPCAMQNLYIHESAEFKDIDQASAVVACAEERPGLMGTAKRMPGMQYTESYPPLEQLYHRCSCSLAPNAERIRYGHQQARPGVPHCGIYIIYLDLDTLWLDDPRELWSHFDAMNVKRAYFGAVEEAHEGGWYAGNKPGEDIPYYGQGGGSSGVGLNAGVTMISLARLRAHNFSAERDVIEQRWGRKHLRLGPQDVLNAYGAEHPERIYELPCIFNFRIGAGCNSNTG
ncbi:MAG: Glucoside xylosyltransferase 2 [Icmadophila ericetorum]|nr:Glucoside xylosyltransferase 2 [Icmadophila ericetorum]